MNECRRAGASGVIETASTTFLLLVAVRWFEGDSTAKAFVAGANSYGLLAGPFVVFVMQRARLRSSAGAGLLASVGAIGFLLCALATDLKWFIVGAVVGVAAHSAATPLNTQMFQNNYPAPIRGRLYSRANTLKILVSIAFSAGAGLLLSGRVYLFPILMCVYAIASIWAAICLNRCPTDPLKPESQRAPWSSFRFVRTDRVFRHLLIAWMLMGLGNLMMLPLRIEYLAGHEHGLVLSEVMIALLVSTIPSAARLALSPIWGWLFDRANFFVLRAAVNVGFLVGILAFFSSANGGGLLFGSIVFGVALAGGDIAWNLWVTKFAPPDRVAEYMSVHTFLTGVRGIVAPILSFQLLEILPLHHVALLAGSLILVSVFFLGNEFLAARRGQIDSTAS